MDKPTTDLVADLNKLESGGKPVSTKLHTDERVLARITDGIYRKPTSAIRELISNAYDADATEVIIQTDAPRFDKIVVRDNGNGLSPEALASLIRHIGGSQKRISDGADIGVVNKTDSSLSPNGRKLIGKIGIGLFSVSQLTQHLQIITKVAGANYRLIADIILKTYSEENLAKFKGGKFETGDVSVWRVPATDIKAHGTEIILTDLKKKTHDELASSELWARVNDGIVDPPPCHIGDFDKKTGKVKTPPAWPWNKSDSPEQKFAKLVKVVNQQSDTNRPNPTLQNTFDSYFQMIWDVSLASPIPYIESHPFDLSDPKDIRVFQIGNNPEAQAEELLLDGKQTIRELLKLKAVPNRKLESFKVLVDDVQLYRPIQFFDFPKTANKVKTPLLFVGKYLPDLSHVDSDLSGGALEFEAYFLWAPKIIPLDHIGALTRINESSGTLFDGSFMKYQVAETTRMRQITGEVYALQGLESALNIDRESFNYAHPHYQILTKWTHAALRQIFSKQKSIAAEVRKKHSHGQQQSQQQSIGSIVSSLFPNEDIPDVSFVERKTIEDKNMRKDGHLVYPSGVFPEAVLGSKIRRENLEVKLKAIAQVLYAFDILDVLSYSKQEHLIRSLAEIISTEN